MILTQLTDRTKILFTMMMSSFVTPFTSSALTLSLPDIGRDYGASANELGWPTASASGASSSGARSSSRCRQLSAS